MREGEIDGETSIVYREGDEIRRLRGHLVDGAPEGFYRLERRDGIFDIAISTVIKVERPRKGWR